MKIIIVGIENIKPILSNLWLDIFIKLFSKDYDLHILTEDPPITPTNNNFKVVNKIEGEDGIIFSFFSDLKENFEKNKTFHYINPNILVNNKQDLRHLDVFSEYHLEELAEHFDNDEISDLQNRFLTFCLPTEKYLENLEISDTRNGVCVLSDTVKGEAENDMDSVYKILTKSYKLKLFYLSEFHKIEDLLTEVSKFNHVCVNKIDFSILIHVLYFCNKLGIKFSYHSDIKFESAKRFIITGCFNYFTKFLETSHFSLRKHILDLLNNQPNETHNHTSEMIGNTCVIIYNKNDLNNLISLGEVDYIYNNELIDHPSIANNEHRDLINLYLRIFHASPEYDQLQSIILSRSTFSIRKINQNDLIYLIKHLNSKLRKSKHINRFYKNIAFLLSEKNELDLAKATYKSNPKIKYFYYFFVSRSLLKDYLFYKIFFSKLNSDQLPQIKNYIKILEKELSDNRSDRFQVSDQNMATYLIILLKIGTFDLEGLVTTLKENKTFTWTHYSTFSFMLYTYGEKELSLQVFELIDINSLSHEKVNGTYHAMMLFTCDILHKTGYFDSVIKNIDYNLYLDKSFKESLNYIPLNSFCFSVILAHFSKNKVFFDNYIHSNPSLSPMYDRINEYLSFDSSKANP